MSDLAYDPDAEYPEITVEALTTYVLAATRYLEAAETCRSIDCIRENVCAARAALDAIERLKRSGKVGILTEVQVNAAMISVWSRLTKIQC